MIQRKDHGRGHSYLIDGAKSPGVTTILGAALPKPALIEWAGKTTASYAVDHWDELATLAPSKRLDTLNRARYEDRDTAANRGTQVHAIAEKLIAGEEVDKPEEIAGHIESYIDFIDTWNVQPVLVEAVIANRTVGYCGTLDLIADLHGTRWLLDLKTSRSGIFGESALQLCAYLHAEVYLDPDGNEQPMAELEVDRVGAVHVRADGWDLRPVDVGDDVWLTFRHVAWLARRVPDIGEWVGAAIDRPRPVEAAS